MKITAKPRIRCSRRNKAKGIAVTEEIVASGEGVGKDAFGFLRDAVEAEMSSAAARMALSSCKDFMEFERGAQRAA